MQADPGARPLPVCLVLSTGRCGSTAMSDIVAANPLALSVSELFSGLRDSDLTERELTGPEFWELLSTPCLVDVVGLKCKIKLDEMLYPAFAPRPGARRFTWVTGLPPLMQACIPHLTGRPDDLYAEIEDVTPKQPRRMLSMHFQWLFNVLAGDRRPAVVVERSGGSLAYAATLMQLFPQARVVHLFRDGRECAVSMSRHGRYKFAMIQATLRARLGYDPYSGEPGQVVSRCDPAAVDELGGLLPERMTAARYGQFDVPVARYGSMWSKMVAAGLAELPDQSRLLAVDYADLTAQPAATISKLFDFLGLDCDEALRNKLASGVRPARNVREEIGEQQWDELTRACRLGMNRLYGRGNWK